MTNVLKVAALAAVAAMAWAGATEDPIAFPTPNPFIPVKLQNESYGEKMRHPFHTIRTRFTDYFKVWDRPRDNHDITTLAIVRSRPKFFLQRKVEFNVYWNGRGDFFRPFLSPFHRDTHVNFSCWNYGIDLWDREQRTDVFPFMYLDLKEYKDINKLDALQPYAPMRVYGIVRIMTNEGYPMIEVHDFEPIKEPTHSLDVLRDLEVAKQQLERKNWSLGASRLEAVLDKDIPRNTAIKVLQSLGEAQVMQRKFGSARETLIQGLRLYGSPRVQFADAIASKDRMGVDSLLMLTRCDLVLGNHPEAKMAADLVIKLDPSNAVAYAERGLALARMGDIRSGLIQIEAGQRMAPGERLAEAHRNRAQIYIMQGNLEGAKSELDQAIILRTTEVQYHLEVGEVYAAMGSFEDAERSFETGVKLGPTWPEPLHKLALLYKIMGDKAVQEGKPEDGKAHYEKALETIKRCHEVDDQYVPAYGTHAEILRALGKPEDAKRILEHGARVAPGSTMSKIAEEQMPLIEAAMRPSEPEPAAEATVEAGGEGPVVEEKPVQEKSTAEPAPVEVPKEAPVPVEDKAAEESAAEGEKKESNTPPTIEVEAP